MSSDKLSLGTFYAIKKGMTRIFDSNGVEIPVTVLELIDNCVSRVKTEEKDKYNAYQIAYNQKKEKLITKPVKGQLKNLPGKFFNKFYEVKVDSVDASKVGTTLGYDEFTQGSFVDVTSVSKGKGFQGVVKRFGFAGGPATHGSHFHRRPGSIGNRATPARVFKNKKLPGHMGCDQTTVQNLQLVHISEEKKYILVRGSVPGCKSSFVLVRKSKKKS